MPRKPSLSPSKITTYLACPVKYKWTYVDPRGKWFLRSKSYYSFGASLHSVLQRFHDEGDRGVQTAEQAVAALEENWITAGFASPEEAEVALAEGRDLVATYVEEHYRRGPIGRTLYVEKQLRKELGQFVLIGRIDRIDERDDGTIEIIDYKSGRSETDSEDLLNDVAMNCYQLLVRSMLPDRKVLSTIVALRTQSRTTVEPDPAALEQFERDIVAVGTEILNRDYESLLPTAKDICLECDFLQLCMRHEDFAEEVEAISRREPEGADA
ncbi:MAG: PD-(D/E)XK nuclease family protein [Armatimonadetes bacterium]|nr:PD-(D/E)XK nuclease family protein [Armatimonadota bacterium]NOG93927.1 PD-(D/E)XK nuclease family protein [Armatimonadota bacterium]